MSGEKRTHQPPSCTGQGFTPGPGGISIVIEGISGEVPGLALSEARLWQVELQ